MTNTTFGFVLLRDEPVEEVRGRARLYKHQATGAQLLSIECDDSNKVFGITFRTPPADSTGVAHILEHAVLCGSRKYPVKEPFVELLKGSLKTFLNAFTYPDKTCYPVASQNLKDFYNLIDVYMDAVLFPRLTPQVHAQEGWHYELNAPQDPLAYKGVVFNEMKGAYSSPDNRLAELSQQALFPDTAYGFDSGGDPRKIPDLSYEQLRDFHRRYYHPANARIWFYGDDDPQERLRLMNEYLSEFGPLEVDSDIAPQAPFDRPRWHAHPYDAGNDHSDHDKKAMVAVNWGLAETTDVDTALALSVLSYILIGSPGSPLRKALLDSGLGEDLCGVGLDSDLRQLYFSVGLKGIAERDAVKVETLILDTLQALADSGIDRETIEAALNKIEFALRENNTGSYPRGLSLMLRALTTWLYDGDPLAPLRFEKPLAALKEQWAKDEGLFEDLIRRYFLRNNHRATVLLSPDSSLRARQEVEEQARLDAARAAMSADDLQRLVEAAAELKRRQETPDSPEALACIPSLTLADIDRAIKTVPRTNTIHNGARLLYHDQFTNGILYLDLGLALRTLTPELVPYLGLFGRALLEMGTEQEDYVSLSKRIDRATGGIGASPFLSVVRETLRGTAWLFLRGKAMISQAPALLDILRDVLLTPRLDNRERFKQIVLEEKAMVESALAPQGHAVVQSRLRARFNEADHAAEQAGGVSYLFFLRRLLERLETDWPAVLSALYQIRAELVNRQTLLVNTAVDAENYARFEPQLRAFVDAMPGRRPLLAAWGVAPYEDYEALTFPAQVNYVGKAANLYALGYAFHGSALVIAKYLRNTWLWDRVRVVGGAYGGFCSFDQLSGVWSFVSYRDPNLNSTLAVYDASANFLRKLQLSTRERERAIIGTISDLDAYLLPDAKSFASMIRFLIGYRDADRQQTRDEVLSTTNAHFRQFAEVLAAACDNAAVVVLGSPQAIEEANQEQGGRFRVTKVL